MAGVALAVVATVLPLADDGGGEAKKAGPIALVVILLLAIACYFLFRSMTRHLRKVREQFPETKRSEPADPRDEPPPNGTDNGPSSARPDRGPSSP